MYSFPTGTAPSWHPWNPAGTGQYTDWTFNTSYWYTCPKCSKLIQWGSAFCPNCGHKLIQEETDADKLEKILAVLEEMKKEIQCLASCTKVKDE